MTIPETYRTFVALPLSDALHKQLARIQRELRRACPERSIRWVNPEGIHLTVFFIGDVILERIEPTKAALAAVARNVPAFSYQVRDLGAFPNLGRPRVVWVGVEDTEKRLALVHQAVNEALSKVGFTPETRRFSPHLTLGRVRRKASRADKRRIGDAVAAAREENVDLGEEPAQEIILFRSILKSTGAEYTPLARFPLVG
jgi:2'-5' RNA ligase